MRKWQLKPWAFMATLLLATGAAAPGDGPNANDLARLDGFAQGLALADKFSGVVLVAQDGVVLSEKAYGKRDEKTDYAVALDTRFNTASAGKMFTSTAILQLIAKGKLTLDTPVGKVIRTYRNKDIARHVTVRHLLTHMGGTGGIDELFGTDHAAERARLTDHAAMVALHDNRAPAFPPGSKQDYGNFGYVILGRMVELLSGEDYYAYVQRHIFDPAGMRHTSYAMCADPAMDIARGYADKDGTRISNCATGPARGFAAGGAVTTARDMLNFVTALNTGKLVPPALFAEATRTQHQFMGLGFFATEYGPGIPARNFRWGHGGSSDGICTDVRHYPRTGETVIVLSNRDAPACFPVASFLHDQWLRDHPAGDTAP